MEEYFQAKARLFRLLKPEEDGRPQAIINTDDLYGRQLLSLVDVPVLSYGLQNGADVQGFIAGSSVDGTQ